MTEKKGPSAAITYLADCSPALLEQFELAKLNDAANLRKQMIEILDQLTEVLAEARLARLLVQHYEELSNPAERPVVIKQILAEVLEIARQPGAEKLLS